MALRKKTPPTFEQRHNAAGAIAGAALSVFETVAADLQTAGLEHAVLAADLEDEIIDKIAEREALVKRYNDEIDDLHELLARTVDAQIDNENAAQKILALFS